uniref:Nbr1 FW domain-containing protein n=1 Tax=Lygus hesperus TaxID=30085 RepID=A0A0K8S5B5_LYGHE
MNSDSLDQQLLQQFSCLGTTDKDELIKQLQVLVGNNLSYTTAHFFLDMNNWNLQAAVGAYFDFDNPAKLPSMALVDGEITNDALNLPPSTSVMKKLILWNNGDEPWPDNCALIFAGGDVMGDQRKVNVPNLPPNNFAQVEVMLESPSTPGMYKSKWRMCTPSGSYFGDTIWVIMTVTGADTSELAKQLSNLNTCGENPPNHRSSDSNCIFITFGSQPTGRFGE